MFRGVILITGLMYQTAGPTWVSWNSHASTHLSNWIGVFINKFPCERIFDILQVHASTVTMWYYFKDIFLYKVIKIYICRVDDSHALQWMIMNATGVRLPIIFAVVLITTLIRMCCVEFFVQHYGYCVSDWQSGFMHAVRFMQIKLRNCTRLRLVWS